MTASIADYADTATAQEVLHKFLDWVEGWETFASATVLELGCGAGHLTEAVCGRMGKSGYILATDPDESYLREAKAKLAGQKFIHPAFRLLKAQDVNLLESVRQGGHEPFEFFVWANGVHYLEQESDMTSFLEGIRGVCISGGFFCTSFWQGSVSMRDFAVLGRMTRNALEHLVLDSKDPAVPKSRRLHEWSLADYERFAREAGYETVEIVQVPMQLPVDVYQGIAHDVTWVDNALPPEGKLAAFSREERIKALVVGAQKAYEAAGVETTQRIWAFVRVA